MLKELVKKKRNLMNLLISEQEYAKFKKKADQYTNGNVSAWLRYAGEKHVPKRTELAEDVNKKYIENL